MDPALPGLGRRQVAILAYGSLIADPGPAIAPLIADAVPARTPFPVEFGRASQRWGGGPVLVPHRAGGRVNGALLVLRRGVGVGLAVDVLSQREGADGGDCVVEVAEGVPAGLLVITAAMPRNLPRPDMEPAALARRAARSVAGGPRNGVAYLRRVTASGVRTPRTAAYEEALIAMAGAADLEDAERRLVAFAAARPEGGNVGLG